MIGGGWLDLGGHVGDVTPFTRLPDPGGEEAGLVVELDLAIASLAAPAASNDGGVAVEEDSHFVAFGNIPMAVAAGEGGKGLGFVFDHAARLNDDVVGVEEPIHGCDVEREMGGGQRLLSGDDGRWLAQVLLHCYPVAIPCAVLPLYRYNLQPYHPCLHKLAQRKDNTLDLHQPLFKGHFIRF